MQILENAYGIGPTPKPRAGAWFRELDHGTEFFRVICKVADATLLHDGRVVLDASTLNDRLFGCSPSALLGKPVSEVMEPLQPGSDQPGPAGGGASRRYVLRVDGTRTPVLAYEVAAWCHGRAVKLVAIRTVRQADKAVPVTGLMPPCAASSTRDPGTEPLSPPGASTPVVLGIAHDLNGMLTGVQTALELLERRGMDAAVHRCALEACKRATRLVAELVTVGMGGTPDTPLTSLDEAIRRGVRLATDGSQVDVTIDVEDGLWPVHVNEASFERVIYNLALNAVQAMRGGGALHVTASNVYVHQPSRGGVVAGRAVRVSIRDAGPGIPSAALASIFEPFFTTKPQGMGIGLAACRALVLEAGGDITVESTAGAGTTFHTYLPAGVHSVPPPGPGALDSE